MWSLRLQGISAQSVILFDLKITHNLHFPCQTSLCFWASPGQRSNCTCDVV